MATANATPGAENGQISEWSVTGAGLSESERAMWRSQLSALILISALDRSPGFWAHVDACRSPQRAYPGCATPNEVAAAAWRHARAYGTGRRRRAVARLILRAAADRHPRIGLISTVTHACFVSHDEEGRSSTYRLGAAFAVPLIAGAELIASRGAGRCLADGCQAPAASSDYCRRHDALEPPSAKTYRERQARRAFDASTPAILSGLGLPAALEDALEDR